MVVANRLLWLSTLREQFEEGESATEATLARRDSFSSMNSSEKEANNRSSCSDKAVDTGLQSH